MTRNIEALWKTSILNIDSDLSTDEDADNTRVYGRGLTTFSNCEASTSSTFNTEHDYYNAIKRNNRGHIVMRPPRTDGESSSNRTIPIETCPMQSFFLSEAARKCTRSLEYAGPSQAFEVEDLSCTGTPRGQDLTTKSKRKSSKHGHDGKRFKAKWRELDMNLVLDTRNSPTVDNQEMIVVDDYSKDTPAEPEIVQLIEPQVAAAAAASTTTGAPPAKCLGDPTLDKHAELNRTLLKLLECPVCLDFMSPPIHHCKRGHLVCKTCKARLDSCPYCRSRLCETRNLAMEQVAESLLYPCEFYGAGCQSQVLLREKLTHENNCQFRIYNCFFEDCFWKGQHPEIMVHMQENHQAQILFGSEHVLDIGIHDVRAMNWLLSVFGEMFHVHMAFKHTDYTMCIKYVGPVERATNFTYTIDISCGSPTKRSISFSRLTHRYTEKINNIQNFGEGFYMRFDTARLFMNNGYLRCNVTLKQV